MAKVEYIRKNALTGEYEHQAVSGSNIYWSPGLTGMNWINNLDNLSDAIAFGTLHVPYSIGSNIVSYSDISKLVYGNLKTELNIEKVQWLNYLNNVDIGIRELQPDAKPEILEEPLTDETVSRFSPDGNMNLVLGNNTNFTIDAINPIYDLDYKLAYRWLKNNEVINNNKTIIVGNSIHDTGTWLGEVYNDMGVTQTQKINLTVHDPRSTKKFYANLIKNGNAEEGFRYWDIINGSPEIEKIGVWPNQPSDLYFTDSFFNRGWIDLTNHTGERTEPFGPFPSMILNGNPYELNDAAHYFRGGVAGDNNDVLNDNFVVLKQEIDLSSVSEFIDRKVYGVNDVYGNLFGWLGNMGLACGLNQTIVGGSVVSTQTWNNMTWGSVLAKWQNNAWQELYNYEVMMLDKVYIQLKMFNESDMEIHSEYVMSSPLHRGQDFKFFLRNQHLYIPYGTRRIEVWIKFQRGQNAIWKPTFTNGNIQGTPTPEFIKVAKYNHNIQSFQQIHTSAVQNLNLHLYINDTDEYWDKIKNYPNSINFKQYEMRNSIDGYSDSEIDYMSYMAIKDLGYRRISDHAGFISNQYRNSVSAIHLKVVDIVSHRSDFPDVNLNFQSIVNYIKNLSWFNTRFHSKEIWNSVLDAIQIYGLPIDINNVSQIPVSSYTQHGSDGFNPNYSINGTGFAF